MIFPSNLTGFQNLSGFYPRFFPPLENDIASLENDTASLPFPFGEGAGDRGLYVRRFKFSIKAVFLGIESIKK